MKFDCAIFDLDGTLVDSQHMWTMAKLKVLTDRGIGVDPDQKRRIMSMEFPEITHHLSSDWPTNLTPEQVLAEITQTVTFHYAQTIPMKKGMRELLEYLHSVGIPCCLATASWEERFMPMLQRLGADKLLDHIVTARMVGRNKHFPDVFLEAARRCGANPQRSVVFEDSRYSVKAAKQAGFWVVGINEPSSDGDAQAMQAMCDWFVDDVTQLPKDFWTD